MRYIFSQRRRALLPVVALALVALVACADDALEVGRSIGEIHDQEGIPVATREISPESFRSYQRFTTSLSGNAESTASSLVGDVVQEVLYDVGDYVERDTVVVTFPTDNPALNYEQARVGYENAATSFARIRRLHESGNVTQQSFDDAKAQYDVARANWDSARNMVRVRAPISGYITRIQVGESDNVARGDALFTVADYEQLRTTVWVSDRHISSIEVGQAARAVWQSTELDGEVVRVDMGMDEHRKAFAVRLRFENPNRRVPSGVTASVTIETYRNDQAIVLDFQEVLETSEGSFAFVVEDDTAVRVRLEVARRQGTRREVSSGLSVGDVIVSEGVHRISDGSRVRVVNDNSETGSQ
ncbi:MAG: efflux RND transporter periplasmic adaptor subunit [Spirochaetaceae bacterium]|nr:MAG: efflux RND transporter periplasmic adaptor subunit [Spirochaetaceae bacterium]